MTFVPLLNSIMYAN